MVKLVLTGKGTTLEAALDYLKVSIDCQAQDRGLIVPEDWLSAVSNYIVGIRRQNGGRYRFSYSQTYQEAFEGALVAANLKEAYNPAKHRIFIGAELNLKALQGELFPNE